MVHATHTLRIASHRTHTAPAVRRKSDVQASAEFPAPAADFRTELSKLPYASATVSPSALQSATVSPSAPLPISAVASNSNTPVTTPLAATPSTMAPTAQSLFGANPWCTNTGGTGPAGSYSYNPYYFATPETAAKVAQMLGGKVVAMDAITPFGPFQQNQQNQMVQMPDGRLINAGLVAGFYDHGFSQQAVDKMIAAEVSGNTMYS
jgi:hypothetical protein